MKKGIGGIIGVLLLVAGIAVASYGIYEYNAAQQSLGNALGKMFTGKSNAESNAIIMIIAGAASALVGAFLSFSGRRR
ncbi:hypothetical protein MASR2M78_10320 [Treponema sp.]